MDIVDPGVHGSEAGMELEDLRRGGVVEVALGPMVDVRPRERRREMLRVPDRQERVVERLGREQDRPNGASRLAKEPSRVKVREGSGAPAARAADVVMLAEMLPVAREQKLRADLADLKPVPGRSVARSLADGGRRDVGAI